MNDPVNHPAHYTRFGKAEVIDITELIADMEKSESSRERAEALAARKEHEAYVKTIVPGVRTWLRKMDAINNVAIRAVLDLHRRYGEYCAECERHESPGRWPCSTVLAISDSYGLTPEGISDWDLVDALGEIDRKDCLPR